MNTITIELCAEDRARLDAILEALTNGAPKVEAKAEPEHPVEDPFPETKDPAVEPAPVVEAPKKPEAPKVKMEDVQQKVVALSAAGKKAEVRAIVTAYAERVSAVPEDKLAEVLEKLNALEG